MVPKREFATKRGNVGLGKIRVETEFDQDLARIEQHISLVDVISGVRIKRADPDTRICAVLARRGSQTPSGLEAIDRKAVGTRRTRWPIVSTEQLVNDRFKI